MMIVNKSKNMIVNVQQIVRIYSTPNPISVTENFTVTADVTSGRYTNLGQYNSMLEAQTAFEMLMNAIGNGVGVFFMPSCKEIAEYKTNYRGGQRE